MALYYRCISLSASHKILFWKKGLLKNVILIFQNIKKTLKGGTLFAKCKKTTHYPRAILLQNHTLKGLYFFTILSLI